MKRKLLILLSFVVVFALPNSGLSQSNNWYFDNIGLTEGLSNTFVSDILKDSQGYMWMTTNNGLNRYNAYDFQTFKHIPNDTNSLSSDVVTKILEDDKGQLWISTNDGLNLYDKKTGYFSQFFMPGIKELSITTMVQNLDGNLLIGTWGEGLLEFDTEKHSFKRLLSNTDSENYIYPLNIRELYIDKRKNVWVGTNGYGITHFYFSKPEAAKTYHNRLDPDCPMESSYSFAFNEDNNGGLWVGTFVGGLLKYERSKDSFRLIENPYNPKAKTKNGILCITPINGSELALGANGGGVFIFNLDTEKFTYNYLFSGSNPNSLSNDFVLKIYKDDTGIYWIGTESGGVSIYNPLSRKFGVYTKNGDGEKDMPGKVINSIYEDPNGLIWIGTENNGFAAYNRTTNTYNQYIIPNVQYNNNNTFIKSIISDNKGGMWIGANMGGLSNVDLNGNILRHYPIDSKLDSIYQMPDHDVSNLLLDYDGDLWVGAFRGLAEKKGDTFNLICSYDSEGEFCHEPTNCTFQFDNDRLLIGYGTKGLKLFNKRTKEFEKHFQANGKKGELSNNCVNSIYRDKKGRVWVATNNGLNLFNSKSNSFKSFHKQDGLPDNKLFNILEDEAGTLWISSAFGLCAFNPELMTFTNYYVQDGLQSNVFRRGAAYQSKSGELFFGSVDGFNSFHPSKLNSNPHPPQVVFTNFEIFNQTIEVAKDGVLTSLIENNPSITLDHTQSLFSFEFAALNYTLTAKNQYAYKLEGYDSDWNYIGNRRYISFTNIPAGDYTLIVKACNNDGIWNEKGTKIQLTILPPFWQTWWFRSLVAIVIIVSLWLAITTRIRSLKKRQKELEETVRNRTEEIRHKNEEILDSINYAKRIQEAILPPTHLIRKVLPESFVYYRPKDIVAGDFYWLEKVNDGLILAVADCTGHGVPGAMVSVVCDNALNRSVREFNLFEPGAILDKTRELVIETFEQSEDNVKDGMDITLCTINMDGIKYAGANNSLYHIQNNELIEIKADKQPIGNYITDIKYTTHNISPQKDDVFYLFTDGFADQFGGERNKKFKYGAFKKLLLEIHNKPMNEQQEILDKTIKDWMGDIEQIDDICIIGFRITNID